jgi:hypothetical protein
MLDALNVVPNKVGAIQTREGHTLVGSLDQTDVYALHHAYQANGTLVRYQGAGTKLYRNFVPILTGLNGTSPLSFVTMRGNGEQSVYTFVAGGQEILRVKDNGTGLTRWGLAPPSASPTPGAPGGTGGLLNGNYLWVQTFVRKPLVSATVGVWVQSTLSLVPAALPFLLSTANVADGWFVAGTQPFAEVVLGITTAAVGGVWNYAYWNGTNYVHFTPDEVPVYTVVGATRLAFSFPVSDWVPLNGKYVIIAQAVTPPSFAGTVTVILPYDSVIAAQSQASPTTGLPVAVTTGQTVTLTLVSSLAGVDIDAQVTHSIIWRTRGDDPAFVIPGVVTGDPLYFFEQEVPAGTTTAVSSLSDDALQELLELDNNRPLAFTTIAEHQNRLFGAIGNLLYASKPDMPESFPGGNVWPVGMLGDPIRRIAAYDGNLYLFTGSQVFLLMGTDETSYDPRAIQCPTGLGAVNSLARGEKGIYYLGSDGNLWRIQGSSVAVNLSHPTLYPFFHDTTYVGVLPLNQSAKASCAATWGNNRYYLSYPATGATLPNGMLFYDEMLETWWRDSRGFRSLLFDRQADTCEGGTTLGTVMQLETGTVDLATPIAWQVQTRDDDEGSTTSLKELTQVTIEAFTNGQPLAVSIIQEYGASPTLFFGTCTTITMTSTYLGTYSPANPRSNAFGYLLSGSGPMEVNRILPHFLGYPSILKVWDTQATTLGYEGAKRLESVLLDLEVFSGEWSAAMLVDGVTASVSSLTPAGRVLHQHLQAYVEGTIFQLVMSCTGLFALYPSSVLLFRRLPPPLYNDTQVALDQGTAGYKYGLAYTLDVELLGPGILTTTFLADGAVQHTIQHTTQGRSRTARQRLPARMQGFLFEIRRSSTVPYRLWSGTDVEWLPVGSSERQHLRMGDQQLGTAMSVAVQSLPQSQLR